MKIGIFRDRLDGFLVRIDHSAAADAWRWYAAQLNRLARRKARLRSEVLIDVSREGYRLQGEGTFVASNLSAVLRELPPPSRDNSYAVVLAPDRFIKRHLSDISLPRSRMGAIAELDISGSTPFAPASMRILFAESAKAEGGTHCFLVRAEILSQIERDLAQAGLNTTAIYVRDGDNVTKTDLCLQNRKPRWRPAMALSLLVGASAFLYAFLSLWLNAGAANRQLAAEAEHKLAKIQELRPAFEARRAEEARFAELRALQTRVPSATTVLNELARRLPDDSFLESVSWDGQVLTVSGFSQSPPPLIALLEQSSLFQNVAFAGPITKAPGNTGARFEIRMDVRQ